MINCNGLVCCTMTLETRHFYCAFAEDISQGVDTDESPGSGLTNVVSNEGLNYLMYRADDSGDTNCSSGLTESSLSSEDR